MERVNAKSGACEITVAGPATCAGAETPGAPCSADRRIEMRPVDTLKAAKSNARTHTGKQIRQIADSIQRFGFINPILVDEDGKVIAGHGRLAAAKLLGLAEVPALRISHLSTAEKRGYVIADNRLAELAGWDCEILAIELAALLDLNFDIEVTGFQIDDIDIVGDEVDESASQSTVGKDDDGASGSAVSRAGDLWRLGEHELRCGDTGDGGSYAAVDAAIRCWQRVTGQPTMLAGSGRSFAAVTKERAHTAAKARAPRQAAGRREAA